jgi:cell division protease FtsH
MKKNLKSILFYALFVAGTVAIIFFVMNSVKEKAKTTSDLIDLFEKGEIVSFKWDQYNDKITVKDAAGNELAFPGISEQVYVHQILPVVERINEEAAAYQAELQAYEQAMEQYAKDLEAHEKGELAAKPEEPVKPEGSEKKAIVYDYAKVKTIPVWVSFLPYIFLAIVIVIAWIFFSKQMNKMGDRDGTRGVGKAKPKLGSDEKNKVYFKDVAGCDEEKEELTEIVEFLRDPEKFTRLGAKIPHGVLLVGPPGTGKTLLAKAVAGEAGVPFYSISGSDFVELYVGVGASRVRDLFDTARKNPAAIIFIDEIDAVGRHRGTGLGGGHDEREQTLNQLLVEMDGFGGSSGIIVMAATNRPDILDPALLRPGRFDRQVTVNYPNSKGREEILRVHARNKPLEKTVDLPRIAQMTAGFTGADLANVLNEAALLAARKGKSLIGMNDVEEAVLKVMVGTSKKSMKMSEKEKRNTAFHEAGHALMDYYLETQDPVRRISIVPSSKGALGYTLSHPDEDKYSVYKTELKERIASLLGGRVAEELTLGGDFSGGASNDIQRATAIARNMVTRYGMSDLGPILYGSEHGSDEIFLGRDFNSAKTYSEETAAKIDMEIRAIIDQAHELAKKVLTEHFDKLTFVAEFLVKYEEMDDQQFKMAMEQENPSFEEIDALLEEKRRVSRLENEEKKRRDEEDKRKREEELRKLEGYDDSDVNAPAPQEEVQSAGEENSSDDESSDSPEEQ